MWTLPSLWVFLSVLFLSIPVFIVGIIVIKKKKNPELAIFPVKIIAALLLVLELLKQIDNLIINFTPGAFPFHFSDYIIFALASFVFSKKDSLFYKISYLVFMTIGLVLVFCLLIMPNMIVDINSIYSDKVSYMTAHSFFCHYICFFTFIWLLIFHPVKLEWKDICNSFIVIGFLMFLMITMSYVFRCNYDYCLDSFTSKDANNGVHTNRTYIDFKWCFLIWIPSAFFFFAFSSALIILFDKIMNKTLIKKKANKTFLK